MGRRTQVTAVGLALLFGWAASARGVDIDPPDWRGQERTTLAIWDFEGLDPTLPTVWNNPYGDPVVQMAGVRDGDSYWLLHPELGSIIVGIPNNNESLALKDIWIQVTSEDFGGLEPAVTSPVGDVVGGLVEGRYLGYGVYGHRFHGTFHYTIQPNPRYEQIEFTPGGLVWVDQLVIDTRCIPEPATLALLALGGLALIRRRRR